MFDLFLKLLEAAILGLHLVSINLASASPLLCLWLEFAAVRRDDTARQLLPKIGHLAFASLTLGALLGLVYGWLIWSEDYQQHWVAMGSRLTYGIAEWVFSWILLGIAWIWAKRWNESRTASRIRSLLWLLAGTNLLYHFPFLFQVLGHLKQQPPRESPLVSAEFRELMIQPDVLSQATHVIVASVAVVGVALAWITQHRRSKTTDEPQDSEAAPSATIAAWDRWGRRGLHLALWPTLLQIGVGFWVLASLPRSSIMQLTGQDSVTTAAFLGSLVGVTMLVHSLSRGLLSTAGNMRPWTEQAVRWLMLTVWWMAWSSLLTKMA